MNYGENGIFSIKLGIGPYFIIITYLNYHFDNKKLPPKVYLLSLPPFR